MIAQENAKCGQQHSLLDEICLPLHRIIAFSNVEGQGNRTSIFLQGCKLNCLYCHNPETIARHSEQAKAVTLRYLFEQVQQSVPFIRGVTVSGGEPTIHHRRLVPLFKALRAQGLTCYLDTSGFFDFEATRELIDETDKFLFDIKGSGLGLQQLCFDRQNRAGKVRSSPMLDVHTRIKPENLSRNMDNLARLLPIGKIEEVRLVVINGFFDVYALVQNIAELLQGYPDVLLKIIRMHTKGARDIDGLVPFIPSIEVIDALTEHAKQCGVAKVVAIY